MHVDSDGSISLSRRSEFVASWQRCTRSLSGAVLIIGLFSAGQAMAQEAEQAPAPAQAVAPDDLNRNGKVCRVEDVTGSRMRKRVCHTPEQWEARERAAYRAVRELDSRSIGRSDER